MYFHLQINNMHNQKRAPRKAPFQHHFKFLFILSTASTTFSRWPKADNRKNPSPLGPKPEPEVPTALYSRLRLSKREDFMFASAETVLKCTQKVNEAFVVTAEEWDKR
jgi:hypothetical protein